MPRQGVTPFPSICPTNTGELHVTKLLFAFLLLVCHDSRRVEGPLSRDAQHTLVTIPTTKMLPELVESPLASPVHTGGGSEVGGRCRSRMVWGMGEVMRVSGETHSGASYYFVPGTVPAPGNNAISKTQSRNGWLCRVAVG